MRWERREGKEGGGRRRGHHSVFGKKYFTTALHLASETTPYSFVSALDMKASTPEDVIRNRNGFSV